MAPAGAVGGRLPHGARRPRGGWRCSAARTRSRCWRSRSRPPPLTARPAATRPPEPGPPRRRSRPTSRATRPTWHRPPGPTPRPPAPPSEDSSGNPVTFVAANMLDGLEETYWRMPGDGDRRDDHLPARLPRGPDGGGPRSTATRRSARTPAGLLDWYAGNRRVFEVEWTFDDGTVGPRPCASRRRCSHPARRRRDPDRDAAAARGQRTRDRPLLPRLHRDQRREPGWGPGTPADRGLRYPPGASSGRFPTRRGCTLPGRRVRWGQSFPVSAGTRGPRRRGRWPRGRRRGGSTSRTVRGPTATTAHPASGAAHARLRRRGTTTMLVSTPPGRHRRPRPAAGRARGPRRAGRGGGRGRAGRPRRGCRPGACRRPAACASTRASATRPRGRPSASRPGRPVPWTGRRRACRRPRRTRERDAGRDVSVPDPGTVEVHGDARPRRPSRGARSWAAASLRRRRSRGCSRPKTAAVATKKCPCRAEQSPRWSPASRPRDGSRSAS